MQSRALLERFRRTVGRRRDRVRFPPNATWQPVLNDASAHFVDEDKVVVVHHAALLDVTCELVTKLPVVLAGEDDLVAIHQLLAFSGNARPHTFGSRGYVVFDGCSS